MGLHCYGIAWRRMTLHHEEFMSIGGFITSSWSHARNGIRHSIVWAQSLDGHIIRCVRGYIFIEQLLNLLFSPLPMPMSW